MGEDLADKVDDFICAWDKVVGTDLDTLVVLILGWLGFGGIIFTVSHLVYSTLGPGDVTSQPPPSDIPPFKGVNDHVPSPLSNGVNKSSVTPAMPSPSSVSSQIPAQPPPTSEYGVVGSDPGQPHFYLLLHNHNHLIAGAVQFVSLCLQYLYSRPSFSDHLISVWLQNLNQFTIKSAVDDGMLVEFSDIQDRASLSPAATNMTVDTLPNDNLLFAGEMTTTLTFNMKTSRPVKDELIIK